MYRANAKAPTPKRPWWALLYPKCPRCEMPATAGDCLIMCPRHWYEVIEERDAKGGE